MARIQFPIAGSELEWKKRAPIIALLSSAVRDAILAVQPFKRAQSPIQIADDPLLLLRDLNNRDKHRFQAAAVIASLDMRHGGSVEFASEAEAANNTPPQTEVFHPKLLSGGPLLIYRAKDPIVSVKGRFDVTAQVQISLCDGRSAGIAQTLATIGPHVDAVMRQIAIVA